MLRTDACLGDKDNVGGLEAVLLQQQSTSADEDKAWKVIAYALRPLKKHQKNYSAYLVEMAAAVWGIEHFDVYLIDKQFTLVTDHRPLEHLGAVHKKTLNRLQHLMLEYDFTIEYRAGEENAVADYLSRNATMTDTASVQEQVSTLNILFPEAEMDQSKDELFEKWIVRYSTQESIVSDQGKEFCNKVMYFMCDLWGIKKKRTSPFHPQANTGAESFNRWFRKFFMTMLENTKTLEGYGKILLPRLMI
jgi:hypothetical protein